MITKIETINFPTKFGTFLNSVYRISSKKEPYTNFAFAIYTPETLLQKLPLVRIHSSCIFSEALGSLVCDCRTQLEGTLRLFHKKGGIFIYMDQEGRSHGIFNKVKELKLQERGLDTIKASLELGLDVDSRIYISAVEILKDLGKTEIKLVTNNPNKISELKRLGIDIVGRQPMETNCNGYNNRYLKTKKENMGHLFVNI